MMENPRVMLWELMTATRRDKDHDKCFKVAGMVNDPHGVVEQLLERTAPLQNGSELSLECVGCDEPEDSPNRGWCINVWNCYAHDERIRVTMYRDGRITTERTTKGG